MRRRDLLHRLLLPVGGALGGFRLPLAHGADYRGPLFVFVQADGGWDPTSFCDPKTNQSGEPIINRWAETDEPRQAGDLHYAPFARNREFFEKYHRRILVINGVDAQTNSHTVGVTHNWSGRTGVGYPTTTALLAARHGPGLAMPYLSFGGFSDTAGVGTFTRLESPAILRNIAQPELSITDWTSEVESFLKPATWERLEEALLARSDRLGQAPNLLPRAARNRQLFAEAITDQAQAGLREFAALVPPDDDLEPAQDLGTTRRPRSTLRRQVQLALLAFRAGVAVSVDLWLGGFDTHRWNDRNQVKLLGHLTDTVDYLWESAERHGLADRLVVVMGSDFGRTNHYNAEEGKDHWPIGSFVVMEKNQSWTGRAVGETDELHQARKIDPVTLRRNDASGTLIHPKHVHKALRRYLGIEDTAESRRFPFAGTEDFRFFG